MPGIKIALDFDKTITADPRMWFEFCQNAKTYGHEVRIVTFRHAGADNSDISLFNAGLNLQVIYTSGNPKWDFCHALGFKPTIWVDDNPAWIGQPMETAH